MSRGQGNAFLYAHIVFYVFCVGFFCVEVSKKMAFAIQFDNVTFLNRNICWTKLDLIHRKLIGL